MLIPPAGPGGLICRQQLVRSSLRIVGDVLVRVCTGCVRQLLREASW
jgi:hypothetical protein